MKMEQDCERRNLQTDWLLLIGCGVMMMVKAGNLFKSKNCRLAGVICLCFLLTSTAYLAWMYNIFELADAPVADAAALIAAYLLQAAGIGLFSLLVFRRKDLIQGSFYISLALHMACLVPAVLRNSLLQTLFFGLALNLFCGWIAGYYLYRFAEHADGSSALVLGIGYASSIVLSWILSLIGDGFFYYSGRVLLLCLLLTAAAVFVVRSLPSDEETVTSDSDDGDDSGNDALEHSLSYLQVSVNVSDRRSLILAAGLVILFSVVNSCGFGFPSGDLGNGISVEFSRLFYAAGLLIAGFVNARSRRHGAVCALISLLVPFIMLAIRGEKVSVLVFWALSYFTFGFYTVFRIILFLDIARAKKNLWLAGAGLMLGRVGDAAGETLCLTLRGSFLLLIGIAAALFVISSLLFFRLYPLMYLPVTKAPQSDEREIFNRFSAQYDLTAREREVLRLLLAEKTNTEIADILSVTEGTVKFHVHNLLQKTGCRNRIALLTAYTSGQKN